MYTKNKKKKILLFSKVHAIQYKVCILNEKKLLRQIKRTCSYKIEIFIGGIFQGLRDPFFSLAQSNIIWLFEHTKNFFWDPQTNLHGLKVRNLLLYVRNKKFIYLQKRFLKSSIICLVSTKIYLNPIIRHAYITQKPVVDGNNVRKRNTSHIYTERKIDVQMSFWLKEPVKMSHRRRWKFSFFLAFS